MPRSDAISDASQIAGENTARAAVDQKAECCAAFFDRQQQRMTGGHCRRCGLPAGSGSAPSRTEFSSVRSGFDFGYQSDGGRGIAAEEKSLSGSTDRGRGRRQRRRCRRRSRRFGAGPETVALMVAIGQGAAQPSLQPQLPELLMHLAEPERQNALYRPDDLAMVDGVAPSPMGCSIVPGARPFCRAGVAMGYRWRARGRRRYNCHLPALRGSVPFIRWTGAGGQRQISAVFRPLVIVEPNCRSEAGSKRHRPRRGVAGGGCCHAGRGANGAGRRQPDPSRT
jgi:hypothetical protein